MTKRGSSFSDAGSTVKIRQQIRQVKADSSIGGVMLVIDSPGGTVAGTAELGADIADLAASKPMVTFAEDVMCSAALWAGVQAGKVFANSDHATVGSKGVFIGLYDQSGQAAKEGIRPVVIRTGDLKGTGFPGSEISDPQKLMLQQMVDAANVSFDAAMQKRKMSASALAELSRGGVFTGKAAVGMGLIDGIRSFDEALSELRSMIGSTGKRTMKMTETTSTAASLRDLEAGCPGAGADFICAQLRQGATVTSAQSAWMTFAGRRFEGGEGCQCGPGRKAENFRSGIGRCDHETGRVDQGKRPTEGRFGKGQEGQFQAAERRHFEEVGGCRRQRSERGDDGDGSLERQDRG
jgi:signal peptide peptidase SppA